MAGISKDFVKNYFGSVSSRYRDAVGSVGLWKSELSLINKYFDSEDLILDIGCGAGRTTFGLIKNGYTNVVGTDISEKMINDAMELSLEMDLDNFFLVSDAQSMPFHKDSFDNALFSFNGLMHIPKKEDRLKTLKEISRVVKRGGYLIFTTYERGINNVYDGFWKKQKNKWRSNQEDSRLHDFGDKLLNPDYSDNPLFIHVPTKEELRDQISKTDWCIVDNFLRSDRFNEDVSVREFSEDCQFWILRRG